MDEYAGITALITSIISGFGVLYLNSRTIRRDEITRLQDRIIALEAYRDKLESKYEELYRHHLQMEESFSKLRASRSTQEEKST